MQPYVRLTVSIQQPCCLMVLYTNTLNALYQQMGLITRKLTFGHVLPAKTDKPAHPPSLIRVFTYPI